jgi:hypothetical protein
MRAQVVRSLFYIFQALNLGAVPYLPKARGGPGPPACDAGALRLAFHFACCSAGVVAVERSP